jgi:hypothetical protein
MAKALLTEGARDLATGRDSNKAVFSDESPTTRSGESPDQSIQARFISTNANTAEYPSVDYPSIVQ